MQPLEAQQVQALIAAGFDDHRAGRLPEAERAYDLALRRDPDQADALHLLGLLCHQTGRNERAVDLIGRAIARQAGVPSYHNNLGNALNALGRLAAAADAYERALVLKPDYPEGHFNLGVVRAAQGRLMEAAHCYRRTLALRPGHAAAHGNLGNVLQAQGQLTEALAAYRLALTHRPHFPEMQVNLGNVLRALGQMEDARAAYALALTQRPDYAEAHYNLGNLLLELGRYEEAAACYRSALQHKPEYAEAHVNLGKALKELGESAKARECYQRALACAPENAEARLGLTVAAIPVLPADAAESAQTPAAFARSLEELASWSAGDAARLGTAVGSHQPFYLAYRPQDVRGPLDRYGDLVCAAAAARWPHAGLQPGAGAGHVRSRLRLAVLSSQVRTHPVWDVVLRGMLEHLDRAEFEVFLYHTGALTDGETQWAATRVERFVQGPKPVAAWLDEIRRDRPDAIFYPEIGMEPVTGALAALRLAPLQLAGWGHPVTTGLPTIDAFVSGELLEDPGAQRHYREELLRLPGTGVCTRWQSPTVARWSGPERRRDVVRFALCQQPIKFDPADDALLARIACEVGPSEFWLVAPERLRWATLQLRERLARAFSAAGLDPEEHLRVTPWLRREQFLGFLDDMDLLLDCPAFSGYTTAWAALHRGLPIVTREGEFLRQRLAAGLLRQIGYADGIASSSDDYARTAVRFAQESRSRHEWAARRASLREAAKLSDGNAAAVAAFGRALKAMTAANRAKNSGRV